MSLVCIVLISGNGCSDVTNLGSSSVQSPEEWFTHIVADSIPVSVRNIEGYGEVWQGHDVYLKFQASQNFIAKDLLTLHDYQQVKCDSKDTDQLIPSAEYAKDMKFWNIKEVKNHPAAKCYVAKGYKNKWTSEGYGQILVDDQLNEPTTAETYWTVYFHERGI